MKNFFNSIILFIFILFIFQDVTFASTIEVNNVFEQRKIHDVEYYSNLYNVDSNLVLAIMLHETGNFESEYYKNTNNACGLMDPNNDYKTLKSFDSVEVGIIECVRNLKNNYIDLGLTTIENIGSKYAPIGADNDNGYNQYWVDSVSSIYKNLKGE